jgi:hypothetical protein
MSDDPKGKILEPRIWSHITDQLPDAHPLAFAAVYCRSCGALVHASNNECMTTWVETGKGGFCIEHFVEALMEEDSAGRRYYLMGDDEDWALEAE